MYGDWCVNPVTGNADGHSCDGLCTMDKASAIQSTESGLAES